MQPDQTRSTLRDIARSLRVSTATVSNALAGKGRVSAGVAERIRLEAQRQDYRPTLAGRALRTGRSGVVGLVVPDLSNPLFPRMAQALQHSAEAAGLGMLIADSHGDGAAQAGAIERLIQRGADGMIVIPRRGTHVGQISVPVVIIDAPATAGNTVSADHHSGGAMAVQHLADLGHRRFLFIGESASSGVQAERMGGMTSAVPPGAQATCLWLDRDDLATVAAHVRAGITALCATSDLVALRIVSALHETGISIPQDVSLTGFDDLTFSSVLRPGLTTLAADTCQIADHALTSLRALLSDETPPRSRTVPMRLVVRDSTGPAPAHNQENDL